MVLSSSKRGRLLEQELSLQVKPCFDDNKVFMKEPFYECCAHMTNADSNQIQQQHSDVPQLQICKSLCVI